MVLGRQADTAKYIGKPGHNVLDAAIWDINVNDGWIDRGIAEGRTFLFASEPGFGAFPTKPKLVEGEWVRNVTVFFQEVKKLRDAGYEQFRLLDGRLIMVPPGKK